MTNPISPTSDRNIREACVVSSRDNGSVLASVSAETGYPCKKEHYLPGHSIRNNVGLEEKLPHIKEQAEINWKTKALRVGFSIFFGYLFVRTYLLERVSKKTLVSLFSYLNRMELSAVTMKENAVKAELINNIRCSKDAAAGLLNLVQNPLQSYRY